jgi:hypothetical protein
METITRWINRLLKPKQAPTTPSEPVPPRDFAQERETTRTGQMSAEDQAWETQRKHGNQQGTTRD